MVLITRMSLAGVCALALASPSVALAASGGDERDASSKGGGTTTGKLKADGERTLTCDKAKDKLAKAKQKLKKLKQAGASSQAIQKAKQKLKQAKDAVNQACGEEEVLFDITAISGSYDATVTRVDGSSCTVTKDAHWTASLGPGAWTATLSVYYRDNQGRPVYAFSGPPGGIPVVAQGSGVATRTCDQPSPAESGTVSCNFSAERLLRADVGTAAEPSRDPMTLNWFFGYDSFAYDPAGNGGTCSYSGPRPPSLLSSEVSPGLFVSSLNDGSNAAEPVGISTVPASTFAEDSVTLNFSGSGSASFGGSFEASWQETVSFQRR